MVSALAAGGLRLEFLHEHHRGHFRFPARQRVPQVYSLRADRLVTRSQKKDWVRQGVRT